MALTLTSITPGIVPYNGGHLVELRGTFPLNTRLEAYIGVTGSNLDWRLHSGVPGQGDDLYALSEGYVRAYTPVMQQGGPYKVFVTAPDLAESDTLVGEFIAVVPSYRFNIYSLRTLFTPIYKVGPRRLSAVPPLLGS